MFFHANDNGIKIADVPSMMKLRVAFFSVLSFGFLLTGRELFASNRCIELLNRPSSPSFDILTVINDSRTPLASSKQTLGLKPSEEYQYLIWRHRGGSKEERLQADLPKIMELAERLLAEQGVQTERSMRTLQSDKKIPVLRILPQGGSLEGLNQLAVKLNLSHFGLDLIYDPYTLLRHDGQAYFQPTENFIGIPHSMVLRAEADLSFNHELIHANHFALRLRGQDSLYHGTLKLLEGRSFVAENTEVYHQYMSFEEILTSLVGTATLVEAFHKDHWAAELSASDSLGRQQFDSLFSHLKTGYLLNKQTIKVLQGLFQEGGLSSDWTFQEQMISSPDNDLVRKTVLAKKTLKISDSIASGRSGSKSESLSEIEVPLVTDAQVQAYQRGDLSHLTSDLEKKFRKLLETSLVLQKVFEESLQSVPLNFADVIEYENIDKTLLQKHFQKIIEVSNQYGH